jgi:tetratricopeptide (TPR) repeat protein
MRNRQGRFSEAERLAREAVELHRQRRGNQHPETAWALSELARALQGQQQLADAETALRESLAIFRRCYGETSEVTRSKRDNLMSLLSVRGDTTAIEALAKEEAAQAFPSGDPAHSLRAAELLLIDNPSKDARKLEARRLIRQAMDEYGHMAADTPQNIDRRLEVADGCFEVARLCLMDPAFDPEIDEAYRRLTNELEKLLAEFPDSARLQSDVAIKYRDWGRFVQGNRHCLPQLVDTFRRASRLFEKLAHDDPKLTRIWFYLAHAYVYVGDAMQQLAKPEDAEAELQRAIEVFEAHAAEIEDDLRVRDIQDIAYNYCFVAYYLSATHRAEQAADYVRRAARVAKRLAHPGATAKVLYYVALMQARLGDTAGYRATCKTMVGLPFSEIEPAGKGRLIVTLCLLPGALEDPRVPVKLVEEHLATNPRIDPSAGPNLLGTALHRAGQLQLAAEQLENALELYPSGPPLANYSINSLRLRLAMTKWQLGQRDAARELLSKTLPAIEEEMQTPTCLWNRRALLELWRSEAKALIGPKEADKAVENEVEPVTSPDHEHLTPDT